MTKIKLTPRVGTLLLSIFGDFDNIVRLGKTSFWLVKDEYLAQLSKMGIDTLRQYRNVGKSTMSQVHHICKRLKKIA
jgi:hypothetical protein